MKTSADSARNTAIRVQRACTIAAPLCPAAAMRPGKNPLRGSPAVLHGTGSTELLVLTEPENFDGAAEARETRNFLQGGRAMGNENESAKVCKLLPHDARERLVKAASTPTPPGDPLARARAIEEAALYARLQRPALFQK